jgi:hypothetical protein
MVYRKGKRSDGRDLSEHHLRKEELEEELTSSRNWAGIDRNCEL